MKKYEAISCTFYDFIEHFATLKQEVDIKFMNDKDETVSIHSIIMDTQNIKGEEFMLVKSLDHPIRLDRIISIEDKILAEYRYC